MHYLIAFSVGLLSGGALSYLFAVRVIAEYKSAYTLLEARALAFRQSLNTLKKDL
jgi:hypothetical protein